MLTLLKDRVIRLIRAIIIKIICVKIHKNTSFLIIFYYLCPKYQFKTKDMSTSTHVITPDLQAKLDKAREEHKNGETLCFSTAQDAIAWMETL